ncbi:helix-turn-helix domain-containing protein [Peribacillus frigoritolerans]|uniref:helix-turn-helix transcriptional regulator n=1 Tax=Peribacillus frigoritolerans TaxID=450367 RepID=UPI002B24B087|nr:helix-turn-helix domain-containing protein [Peribacillus frigoritolerans]MEB2492969.1 helix-turn-helix domain-containing protein [Peribacillus frigoritolerans]
MEGVYTYLCENCSTLFGVVSRFYVMEDRIDTLTCPKCSKKVAVCMGEGHINYANHESREEIITNETDEISQLPELLTVEHLAAYLNVSERTADEYMGNPDFPLIRLKRSKRVIRDDFLAWLQSKKE